MTKKKPKGSSEREQSDRFKEAAQKLIDAGELNPIDADLRMEEFFQTSKAKKASRSP